MGASRSATAQPTAVPEQAQGAIGGKGEKKRPPLQSLRLSARWEARRLETRERRRRQHPFCMRCRVIPHAHKLDAMTTSRVELEPGTASQNSFTQLTVNDLGPEHWERTLSVALRRGTFQAGVPRTPLLHDVGGRVRRL